MITQQTAERIWHCHREIAAAETLIAAIQETINSHQHDDTQPTLSDAWGRQKTLQLGVPTGECSHRIFQVSLDLAEPVIKMHIANKAAELAKLREIAKIELAGTDKEQIT